MKIGKPKLDPVAQRTAAVVIMTMAVVVAIVLTGCLASDPTRTENPTTAPTLVPTATAVPPTVTPEPTIEPTIASPQLDWSHFPNRSDFRALMLDEEQGDMWLASLSGLFRFDQSTDHWEHICRAKGLADNTVVSLARYANELWVGTQGGVSRVNLEEGTISSYTTADGLSSNRNVELASDGTTLWAGTLNGLSWYDPINDSWTSQYEAAGIELSGVDALLPAHNWLWISVSPDISTKGGLLRMNLLSGDWEALSASGAIPFSSFSLANNDNHVWAVPNYGDPWEYQVAPGEWRKMTEITEKIPVEDQQYSGATYHAGALWIYAPLEQQLIRYSPVTRRTSRFPASPLTGLEVQGSIVGDGQRLWFTGRNGIASFNLNTAQWNTIIPLASDIRQVYGTYEEQLLVRTELGAGLWQPQTSKWKPVGPVGGATERELDFAAVSAEGPDIYLARLWSLHANIEPLLRHYREPGAEPYEYILLPPAGWTLQTMLPEASSSAVWFTGDLGILSYHPAIDQWGVYPYPPEIDQVHTSAQEGNTVWLVSGTDLISFDMLTGQFAFFPLPSIAVIYPAITTTDDAVWLWSGGHLNYWQKADQSWTEVESAVPCLSEANILATWDNAIWLGGAAGVGRLELSDGTWYCYGPTDGMMDIKYNTVTATSNAIWFHHNWLGLWSFGYGAATHD
ncbi:MAG: hypothetical protein ABFQ89_02585 [Chloroflexota bacterium]